MLRCIVCGTAKDVTLEPRYSYGICKFHENIPPAYVHDRYYLVEDPITRALGGTSTRWGIVDSEALPLKGQWCNAGVYTSKALAQGMTNSLNVNDRLMKLDAALYPDMRNLNDI